MSNATVADTVLGVNNYVNDASLKTGLWISTIIGLSVLAVFCLLQRTSALYKYRLITPSVTKKPPEPRSRGWRSLIDWAVKAVVVSDMEFLQSCGLDAMMMVKLCTFGVQLFFPLSILSCGVLLPVNLSGNEATDTDAQHTQFMELTMSNIKQKSGLFWVHLVFIHVYVLYAMVLLRWHYQQYLIIRHHYLTRGDDVNKWREVYQPKEEAAMQNQATNFMALLPLMKALMPAALPSNRASDDPIEMLAKNAKSSDDEQEEPHADVSVRPAGLNLNAIIPPAGAGSAALVSPAPVSARPIAPAGVSHGDPLKLLPQPAYLTQSNSMRRRWRTSVSTVTRYREGPDLAHSQNNLVAPAPFSADHIVTAPANVHMARGIPGASYHSVFAPRTFHQDAAPSHLRPGPLLFNPTSQAASPFMSAATHAKDALTAVPADGTPNQAPPAWNAGGSEYITGARLGLAPEADHRSESEGGALPAQPPQRSGAGGVPADAAPLDADAALEAQHASSGGRAGAGGPMAEGAEEDAAAAAGAGRDPAALAVAVPAKVQEQGATAGAYPAAADTAANEDMEPADNANGGAMEADGDAGELSGSEEGEVELERRSSLGSDMDGIRWWGDVERTVDDMHKARHRWKTPGEASLAMGARNQEARRRKPQQRHFSLPDVLPTVTSMPAGSFSGSPAASMTVARGAPPPSVNHAGGNNSFGRFSQAIGGLFAWSRPSGRMPSPAKSGALPSDLETGLVPRGAAHGSGDMSTDAAGSRKSSGWRINSSATGATDGGVDVNDELRQELAVSRSRPSVSARKTLNAVYLDGRQEAVLAQHYTVLVTDVSQGLYGRPEPANKQGQAPKKKQLTLLQRVVPQQVLLWFTFSYTAQHSFMKERRIQQKARGISNSALYSTVINSREAADPSPHPAHNSPGEEGYDTRRATRETIYEGSVEGDRGSGSAESSPKRVQQSPLPALAGASSLGGVGNGSGGGAPLRNVQSLNITPPPAQPFRGSATLPAGRPTTTGGAGHNHTASLGGATSTTTSMMRSQSPGKSSNWDKLFSTMNQQAQALSDQSKPVGASGRHRHTNSLGASGPNGQPPGVQATRALSGRSAAPPAPKPPPLARAATSDARASATSSPAVGGGGPGPVAEAEEEDAPGATVALEDPAAAPPRGLAPGEALLMVAEEGDSEVADPNDEGGGSAIDSSDVVPEVGMEFDGGEKPPAAASNADAEGAGGEAQDGMPADAVVGDGAAGDVPAEGAGAGDGMEDPDAWRVRAWHNWDRVHELVKSGRVARLPARSRYSVVSATFLRLFPEDFDRAIPVINHKEVDQLLLRADAHMAQYEFAKAWEAKYNKPYIKRKGCCGLTGPAVRQREYHRDKLKAIMQKVKEARNRAYEYGCTPSWFVFFKTQRAALVATQCIIHSEDNRRFKVRPAPGPEEVNWPSLWSDFRGRDLRHNLARPLIMLIILFPIGIFTGGLMQLDYLLCPAHECDRLEKDTAEWQQCVDDSNANDQVKWDWYCNQDDFFARLLKKLVVAWGPALLMVLWQGLVLPVCFTLLVLISRKAFSLSEVDRQIAKYMFLFGLFNVFIGGVVGSTIIQGINSTIASGPSAIFDLIGNYLPTSSNYFINYTMFRALVSVPLRMLWPHIGIRMYLLRRYLRFSGIMTNRERAFLLAPTSPRYGFEVGMIMLVFLIGCCFSVVSPVIMPFTLLFFVMSWLFWRWSLLYVYVRKYEGGGTMWPSVFKTVLICLTIFPLFTACVFVTKKAYVEAIIVLITVPTMMLKFNSYIRFRFQNGIDCIPLEAAVGAPHARVDPWIYIPPPLHRSLLGWHPDWMKAWNGWNMPAYSW